MDNVWIAVMPGNYTGVSCAQDRPPQEWTMDLTSTSLHAAGSSPDVAEYDENHETSGAGCRRRDGQRVDGGTESLSAAA